MDAQEANRLLYLLSAYDRREVNADVAQAWAMALYDIPIGLALRAAVRAQTDTRGPYVTPAVLKEHIRYVRADVERDVRSAKARGLVPENAPSDQPLPPAIEQRLRELHRAEYEANNDKPEDIAPLGPGTDLGQIGRRLPRD